MSEGIDDAQRADLPEFLKEKDSLVRDADLIIDRLEQIAEGDPEMTEGLQYCRQVRKRLIETFLMLDESPAPLGKIQTKLSEDEKRQVDMSRVKVLEEMMKEWEGLFTPDQFEPFVANLEDRSSMSLMLQFKTHETLDDQIMSLKAGIRASFTQIVFDEVFQIAADKLFTSFPEDFYELLRPEIVEHLREVASLSGCESIFARFCQLRTQVIALSREVRLVSKHRAALRETLKVQAQKDLTRSQRGRIQRWANELFAARESLIPDQIPLTEHELKGASFNFAIDPNELQGEGKRLHALDILEAATLHAVGKLFQTMQKHLCEEIGDEEYYQEQEDFDPNLS